MESLLASGHTREAVEAAKQFFKAAPGPEAEALLVQAYEARIRALMSSKMYHEARALAVLVIERFRGCRDRIAPLVQQSEMLSDGNFQSLLTELASADGPRRRELETILARELADPSALADSPALPAEHPLKHEARRVCDLFAAVTAGPLPPGAPGALDAIPRQSPLAPWKLLIRALDAFYRREDALALANLSAIPVSSGPSRLVPVLRRLLGEAVPTDDRSLAVTSLLDKVSGGRARLGSFLPRLAQAINAKAERTAAALIQDILLLLQNSSAAIRRTFLATVFHHYCGQGLNPKPLMEAVRRHTRDPDTQRLTALTLEQFGMWEAALPLWDHYLTTMIQSRAWSGASPEVCRVLLHMADLLPPETTVLLDFLGAGSEAELRSMTRAGMLPACFDRAGLLERARAADPDPRAFRALVAHYEKGQPRRAEAEARAWRRAHPADLEPLLHLIRAAERRGALRKALGLLAEAESIDGVHPEVRQSRFRLLLASAERRIREWKVRLAVQDIERLEREARAGEGDTMAYLLALRWACARQAGDAPRAAEGEQALRARVGNQVAAHLILRGVARWLRTDAPRLDESFPAPEAVEGLARTCDLFRRLERPLSIPLALVRQVERALGGASVLQLHSLATGGLWIGQPTLAYAASGYGLAQDGQLLHRFLLVRGQALGFVMAQPDPQRARRCLRVARALAARSHDMSAVREASAALQSLPSFAYWRGAGPAPEQEMTQGEIQRVIASERGHRDATSAPGVRPPRPPKPRRQPRQPDLLQGLLPWLEEQS